MDASVAEIPRICWCRNMKTRPDGACCRVWQLGAHGRQFLGGQSEGEPPKMGKRVCEWQWGDKGFIPWLEESGRTHRPNNVKEISEEHKRKDKVASVPRTLPLA